MWDLKEYGSLQTLVFKLEKELKLVNYSMNETELKEKIQKSIDLIEKFYSIKQIDQDITYLREKMKKLWKQENLHLLEEIIEDVMEEMEIMIDIEEDENLLQESNIYMSKSKEEKYILDNYMLDIEEQAHIQCSSTIFGFDEDYFQFSQETSPRIDRDRAQNI